MGTSMPAIRPEEVDVVIGALRPDLSFLEAWRPILQPYHLIIVQGVELEQPLEVPRGFDANIYTPSDITEMLGPKLATSLNFKGSGSRCFGYLISKKRYIYTVDDECIPAQDPQGNRIHPIEQHISNLKINSVPYFFNTLYDPYREGCDFVRGYPFSLRVGVPTAISHGLWLNVPDYDAPTQIVKPNERNTKYVDAVITVPKNALFPMSGINLAFDKKRIGPAMFSGLVGLGSSNKPGRYEAIDDIWTGLCCKVICDHFGYGVKSGLPYVWCNKRGNALASLRKDYKGIFWQEEIIPFFQSVRLSKNALNVADCYVELAKQVKIKLSSLDPLFSELADSMEVWIEAWNKLSPPFPL